MEELEPLAGSEEGRPPVKFLRGGKGLVGGGGAGGGVKRVEQFPPAFGVDRVGCGELMASSAMRRACL